MEENIIALINNMHFARQSFSRFHFTIENRFAIDIPEGILNNKQFGGIRDKFY